MFVLKVSPGGRGTTESVCLYSRITFVFFIDIQIFYSVILLFLFCAYVSVQVGSSVLFMQNMLYTDRFSLSPLHSPAKDIPTLLIYGSWPHSSDPNEKPIRCL